MNWSPNFKVTTTLKHAASMSFGMKLKKNKESSCHHYASLGYAQKERKRSGLTRSVPRLMRKRTWQEYGRSKFKTKAELQKSL
jgi:hypothetical protein